MTGNCTDLGNGSFQYQSCANGGTSSLTFYSVEKITCYSLIYGIISTVALVGNSLVCFVIVKNPSMRTVTNVFLLNLAIADILFILVTVPGVMNIEIVKYYWLFGELLCKTIPFINIVTMSTSIYTMVLLAINRYYAIVHPLRAKFQHTVRKTFGVITLIWALSVMVAAPQIPVFRLFISYQDQPAILCMTDWSKLGGKVGEQIYSVALFFICFVVPITIISMAYTAIIMKLRTTDGRLRESFQTTERLRENKAENPISRNTRKTTFMMLTVIVVFLVCMLPFNVFMLVGIFLSQKSISISAYQDAYSILTVFVVGSSACNPIIYNFFSLKFRRAFFDIVWCKSKGNMAMRSNDMTSEINRL